MSRRNTVNGRLYMEDPAIMTWQLANEPQPSDLSYTDPQDLLFSWVDRISSYIRLRAPKQLISVGLESKQGEFYFKQVHNKSTVDYATTHCWLVDPSVRIARQVYTDFVREHTGFRIGVFMTCMTHVQRTCSEHKILRETSCATQAAGVPILESRFFSRSSVWRETTGRTQTKSIRT